MIQIEYSQTKFENEDVTNLILFHGEVQCSVSALYYFSVRNIGTEYADFTEDLLVKINQYPLHMKVENDEINKDEIINLLKANQISFKEIMHNGKRNESRQEA